MPAASSERQVASPGPNKTQFPNSASHGAEHAELADVELKVAKGSRADMAAVMVQPATHALPRGPLPAVSSEEHIE